MTSGHSKHTKDEEILISVAESIGSTLGTIAAKAAAVPQAFLHSDMVQSVENEGQRIIRKSKSVARTVRKKASGKLKGGKALKAARRGAKRIASSAKKAVRRTGPKATTRTRVGTRTRTRRRGR
jgi:hypothetical protein